MIDFIMDIVGEIVSFFVDLWVNKITSKKKK